MKTHELLQKTNHRPWELPNQSWKFYQEWNNAIFLHWQVEVSELVKHVPEELEIDLFEGKAWVSIVVFTMEKIRPKYLPAFPPISNFEEINIRTYVTANNKPGVYFLSIEGGTFLSCKVAKAISQLPYRFSKMHRNPTSFKSNNKTFKDSLDIQYKIGSKATQKSDLDLWLTERYALHQDTPTTINEFEIHHIEWPIKELTLDHLDVKYQRFNTLINGTPHKTQYSKGVQVLAWDKKSTPRNKL
ncbi:YqjF family protein [Aquimarina aquimarini]|uniref:YqjF family protein n=1 Tax=Aquimarina aquimarini TaxID=1191734 RepID=UPI001F347E79|nr:DUF2071 domain-containing protein [Aquimarina aquimarini]